MRVTEKGQVTIPLPIRRGLGIKPGSEVELRDGKAVLRPASATADKREKAADELIAHLRSMRGGFDLGGLTVDEFMSLLRD